MTAAVHFLPYEELKIQKSKKEPKKYTLATPWLRFDIEMDLEAAEFENCICKFINENNESNEPTQDPELVSWFLEHFAHFPICYRLPRANLMQVASHWFSKTMEDQDLWTPKRLGEAIIKESDPFFDFNWQSSNPVDLQVWSWENESTAWFAKSPNSFTYDPVSVFTIIRRYHLKTLEQRDASQKLYNTIRDLGLKKDTKKLKWLIALTIKQNYYATKMCQTSLEPCIQRFPHFSALQDFIESEQGHDKLMLEALASVGYKPEDIPTLPKCEFAMRTLFYAAKHNFLAFSCALDMFERDDYQEKDYLASILKEAGFTGASSLLQKHKRINAQHHHDEIGLKLLNEQSKGYGVEHAHVGLTLNICELLSYFMNEVSSDILEMGLKD